MPQLTESQLEYLQANQKKFETVSEEKRDALLQKSAKRWFKEMADFHANQSETLSEEEQEYFDQLVGTGLFFVRQFSESGKKDYAETVCELLTEYTDFEKGDIDNVMKDYDTLTAVKEPEEEEVQEEAQEEVKEEPKAEQEPQTKEEPQSAEKKEHSFFEVKLFDYFRAKNHFEKRNPVSRFFSKIAGKLFHTGEYYALSAKENHLQDAYGVSAEVLESEYQNLNQKNTFDHFATDEVDYSSMSATDKELDEFSEKLKQDFQEVKPEQTSKQVSAPEQPQATIQLQ